MGGRSDEMKAFRELQSHLPPRWALADGDGPEPRDIVVVPSLSFDGIDTVSIDGVIHYEERMLFALNLLRHPRARLVYLTSAPIHPAAVDYMLSLISGIPNEHMRRRLTVLSLYDSSLVPLTQKILQRPRVIERIRQLIRPECGLMTCFTVTAAERSLAVALGVPLYGTDPDLIWLGTKSGSRWAFRKAGVALLPGAEDLKSEADLVHAVDGLWEENEDLERVVVKHNTGFSGQGNAILDLKALDAVSPKGDASRETREQALADAASWTRVRPGKRSRRSSSGKAASSKRSSKPQTSELRAASFASHRRAVWTRFPRTTNSSKASTGRSTPAADSRPTRPTEWTSNEMPFGWAKFCTRRASSVGSQSTSSARRRMTARASTTRSKPTCG
jgi:hypothetical protein